MRTAKNVRVEGLEPPSREALDPKSSVSTNFTTPAKTLFRPFGRKTHKHAFCAPGAQK